MPRDNHFIMNDMKVDNVNMPSNVPPSGHRLLFFIYCLRLGRAFGCLVAGGFLRVQTLPN